MLGIDVTKLNTLIATEVTPDVVKRAQYEASNIKGLITSATTPPVVSPMTVRNGIAGLPAVETTTFSRLVKFLREFSPEVDEERAGLVTYRGFKFRQNGTELLRRAQEAWALMGKLATACKDSMKYVYDPTLRAGLSGGGRGAQSAQEANAIALYEKWFDKSRVQHRIARVRTIFDALHHAVTAEAFEIICEGDPNDPNGLIYPNPIAPGEFGEVRPADGMNRFYLGPIFFNELTQNIGGNCSLSVLPKGGQTYQQTKNAIFTALNASTITMLHELTHIRSIGGTTDVPPNPYSVAACLNLAINAPDNAVRNAENYALFAKDILVKLQFSPPAMKR